MASQPVSALTAILGTAVDSATDLLYLVDTSAGTSESKKMLISELGLVPGMRYEASGTLGKPGFGPTGTSANGWYWVSATATTLVIGTNTPIVGFNATGLTWDVTKIMGWTSGTDVTAARDAALSRTGAGVLALGNGTASDVSGTLKVASIDSGGASNLVLKYNGVSTVTIGAANTPITVAGLTTGTNADTLCLSAGGVILIQAAACTISSLRFKEKVKQYSDGALDIIRKLNPITFKMKNADKPNADWNYDKPQVGLAAEDVAKVVPLAAIYEQDGKTPKSYRQEALIAVLTKGMQELVGRLEKVEARV